ncbi:MAG: hypothetical protein JXR22_09455 [Prolixibacteraceae bacterium]|nr:hypothetical protein [Prolixibacteraceae bacterium]
MNKTIIVELLILLLLVSGCNQENNDPLLPTQGLLKKVENEKGEVIATYTYNKNGTLKSSCEYNIFYYPGKNAEYTYTYNNEGLMTGKNGFEPGNQIMSSLSGAMDKNITCEYIYEVGNKRILSIKTTYQFEEFEELNYSIHVFYSYPDDYTIHAGQVHERDTSSQLSSFIIYHFNTDGNIDEILYCSDFKNTDKPYQRDQFAYDNHPAPYNPIPGPQSVNNVLTKKVTAYNYNEQGTQSVAYVSEYTYTYSYNRNGFPNSVTETMPNQISNTKFYYYQ